MSNNTIIEEGFGPVDNNGDGYEVGCDSCGMPFGWVAVEAELPKKLLLCKNCEASGCISERLEEAAGHGDEDAMAELNRRNVKENEDGSGSFTGKVPF